MHRNLQPGVEGQIFDAFHVLRLAPRTVFGAENSDDLGARRLQHIERMTQLGVNAGRMAHHPDPRAADLFRKIIDQGFEAGLDAGHGEFRSFLITCGSRDFNPARNRSVPPFGKGGLGGILEPVARAKSPRPPFFKGGR